MSLIFKKNFLKIFIFFLIVFTSLFFREAKFGSSGMSDYCYTPPFIGTSVKPNVLIVMDFSGSMQFPAYVPCNFTGYSNKVAQCGSSTYSYNPNQTYSGYFDSNKCYQYSSSFFQEANCDCSNRIGSSTCISGNLLNWVTTTRIDVARMVLTGGRTSQSQGNTFLESEGAEYTIYENSLKCRFTISATTTNNRVMTISNDNGTCPLGNNAISNAQIRIRPSDPNSIRGIIHSFCDTSDLNGQVNEKCKLIIEFMVFASDGRYGEIKTGKNTTLASLISAINNELPYYGTPTGEALWEAYDFYKQSNDHNYEANSAYINRENGNVDPYYDGSGGNATPVYCRKGFVLLISDGAWNGNIDPVVPARQMLINDLRPDLPGKQNIYTYTIYAFGDLDPSTKLQGRQAMITTALFGGFEDLDSNTWPFPFTGIQYPNGSGTCSSLESTVRTNIQTNSTTYCNSRGVSYPLTQCNPPNNWGQGCAEWDTVSNTPMDGLPYNFYEADDAEALKGALLSALSDILRRASSGATVATLSSRKGFSYLVLQPFFFPRFQAGNSEINWIGFLRAFWMDFMSNLREDSNQDKWLNLKNVVDKVFQFVAKEGEPPQAHLLSNETTCTSEIRINSLALKPLFDTGCKLADTTPELRKILVHLGNGSLNLITNDNAKSFLKTIWSNVSISEGLGVLVDDNFTNCLIDYLRGNSTIACLNNSTISDYFKRNLKFDVSSACSAVGVVGERVWKLGDIIFSTPSIISNEPNNIYHTRYLDITYRRFISSEDYKKRTMFAFVGANDGMLHAFRMGFLTPTGNYEKPYRLIDAFGNTETSKIAQEEWAFIPQYAIPYLIWYGHKDYCHIPTVDYRTFIVDVSIGGEPENERSESSWRTLLIGVLGFGGKEICLQKQGSNCLFSYSSSIFVLDLTEWLKGSSNYPSVLWEAPIPDKTLTLSFPVILRFGESTKNGKWYLVIGSGPKDPKATNFVNQAKLYFFNLRNGEIIKTLNLPEGGAVGDILPIDFDNDYQDDAIYFGTYNSTAGNLYRLSFRTLTGGYKEISSLSDDDISKAFQANAPIFAQPAATKDKSANLWIFFGTGRFFNENDKIFNYNNYLVAFKDPCWIRNCSTPYNYSHLDNKTNAIANIVVTRTTQICSCDWDTCSNKEVALDGYYNGTTETYPSIGWYHQLENTNDYKELIISQPFIFGGNLDAFIFRSTSDICKVSGETWLIALCYDTGIPCQKPSVLIHEGTAGSQITLKSKYFTSPGSPPLGQPYQVASYKSSTGQYEKIAQASYGIIIRLSQQVQESQKGRFILWLEK